MQYEWTPSEKKVFAEGFTRQNTNPKTTSKRILRVDECAKILRCSTRHVFRLCLDGQLTAFKVGKSRGLRVISQSLNEFILRQISKNELENGIFSDWSDTPD